MEWGTFLIKLMCVYYMKFLIDMLFGGHKQLKEKNLRMERYRKKVVKGIDEQLAFLDEKYPYKEYKFSWRGVLNFLLMAAYFSIIFIGVNEIFRFYDIHIKLWVAIIILGFFPLILNMILRRYHLQNSTLSDILRWK